MSEALNRYEMNLRNLHHLIKNGEGDGDEADTLRDAMDADYWSLTDEDCRDMNDLSAELYEES